MNAALGARLKPTCTHSKNLPVSEGWGALPRRCRQRRRYPGLGEVQYSNILPIVDAVGGYVLLDVYTSPTTAVNQDHILRLDLYQMCFSGGQHSRADGRQAQVPHKNVRFVHARASVSTQLLYALGLVARCPVARFVQKHVR